MQHYIQLLSHVVITVLTLMALYTDLKRREIEDYVWIIGVIYSIIISALGVGSLSLKQCLIGGIGSLLMFYIIPIGGGDVKFFAFLGSFFGLAGAMAIFVMAAIFGVVGAIPYCVKQKKLRAEFPLMVGIAPATLLFLYYPNNPLANKLFMGYMVIFQFVGDKVFSLIN